MESCKRREAAIYVTVASPSDPYTMGGGFKIMVTGETRGDSTAQDEIRYRHAASPTEREKKKLKTSGNILRIHNYDG